MKIIIILVVTSYMLLYIYCSLEEPKTKEEQTEKEKNKIIFEYNGSKYKYKDNRAFYKTLQHIEETKFFVKSIDEKERIADFIQLYYPDSKIYKIEL